MLSVIRKILYLFSPAERTQATLLVIMILIMALLDTLGVASIMPFMAVLATPEIVESNAFLSKIYTLLNFEDTRSFMLFLGVALFLILLVSLGFKGLVTYAQLRFTFMREYSIARRLVLAYLDQSYEWFLNRNSADLGKSVLLEVNAVVGSVIVPMMTLLAQGAVTCALLVLLIIVDPLLALIIGGVLGVAYASIYLLMSSYLSHIGANRIKANEERFTALMETFGGIKEIKFAGLERISDQKYMRPAGIYARAQAVASIIGQVPRFALEGIAFGGMLLVILFLMSSSNGFNEAIPVIALYAFAGYRLLPALQAIYASFTSVRYNRPALENLYSEMKLLKERISSGQQVVAPVVPEEFIQLIDVSYSYKGSKGPSLKNIDMRIPTHSSVGIVGVTGSGKTTAIDLILGLLEPSAGCLSIDDVVINDSNRRDWQHSLGYVPQHIYLTDDSIAANIAFGVDRDEIDMNLVEQVARVAHLHDFVIGELADGYLTKVGERGVRLSGGQRQRIGIARALYRKPHVLILDEATSALDSLTERSVMDAVRSLAGSVTIIIVAHRLTTVESCDKIYFLEKGCVKAEGTYRELVDNDEAFRAMSGA